MIRHQASVSAHRLALAIVGSGITFAASSQTSTGAGAESDAERSSTLSTINVTAQQPDSYTVKETSGAAKLTLTPRETPQSMTIMTRERLEDQNLTSLRSVLDNTPGVYSNAYDSERVIFYSRGFVIDTLMYDGIVALPNFSTGSLDQTLDTALYERIEVVRGATGLMTGAGNPAAAINLVRKHADSKAPTISASVTVGSWNNRRTEIDGTLPLTADGRIRARGVLAAEEGDSYQALYHRKRVVGYGIIDADLTPQTQVSFGVDYQQYKPKGVTWGSFPLFLSDGSLANWPTSVTTATNWSYWNRSTQNTFGEFKHTFDNGWSIKSTLSRRQYKEDVQLFYMYGFPDATTGEGLAPYAYKSRNNITENAVDVYASGPFELFGRKHELVFGYSGSRAKNTGTENATVDDLTTTTSTGNFFQWDGSYAIPAFQADSFLSDIRTTQDAAYAVGRFSLADSLKLIAGARYTRWKVDSNYVYNTPNESKYNFPKLVPYSGLIWDFAPNYSAFASYTGIFKPQNNRDISGKYLDPMVGRSVEVGIKGEHFDKRLNTSFTVFQTKQDNVASAVLDANGEAVLLPDGSAVSQAIDGTTTKGFELEASGRLTREINASLGWTKYITRDASGAAIRTFIPGTLVRTFATWEPRDWVQGLTLGGGVNWQSKSNTTVGSPNGAVDFKQGSVALVSLMARYQLTPNVSLQFNANNVTNRKYYVLDQYDNTYYGTPANYSLTLRASY